MSIDSAVGALVEMATTKGRSIKADLSVGICGEHGGEPKSVAFCHGIDSTTSRSPLSLSRARRGARALSAYDGLLNAVELDSNLLSTLALCAIGCANPNAAIRTRPMRWTTLRL